MKKLLNTLPQITHSQSTSSLNSIKEFYLIIDRETKRADRYGLRISLVIFEVNSGNENNIVVRRLVRVLHKRIRSADALGWFANRQIGVLLPHTPEQGAWKITEDIYSLLSSTTSLPPFTVYTYPSDNWPVRTRKKFLRFFLALYSLFGISARHTLPDSNETRILLNLELDRAIRHNYIFSLLILNLDSLNKAKTSLKRVTKSINTYLRDTDSFGWFEERSLAIILPYANQEHAEQIAKRISINTNISKGNSFQVFTYPTNWFEDTKQHQHHSNTVKRTKNNQTESPSQGPLDISGINDERQQGTRTSQIDSFIARPFPLWKRCLDVIGASIGILLLSPVFLFTYIGIKLSSPGPVLFFQERVGFKKKKFLLIKFRSMHLNSGAESHRKFMEDVITAGDKKDTKLKDDPRIFPFGKFIRKCSIDELPQLYNIIKGEMSLVGPRPCMDYEAEHYLRWHTKRFYAMPGLTGLWQVSGKNRLSFKEMIRLDIHYQKHLSLLLDLKILLKTIPAVISIFTGKNDVS